MRRSWLLPVMAVAGSGIAAIWLMRLAPATTEPQNAPILSLEKMGQLVSLKVHASDVVEVNAIRAIDIPFNREIQIGSIKVLLVARGECTIATDLGAATYQNIDKDTKVLTVSLPMPQPLQVRINHAPRERGGSYFYSITTQGVESFIPDSTKRTIALDQALATAQMDLERACMAPPNVLSARHNAESVLRTMFIATGWTPNFVWK